MRPERVVPFATAAARPAGTPSQIPMHERVVYELARLRVADTRAIRRELQHLRRMHD